MVRLEYDKTKNLNFFHSHSKGIMHCSLLHSSMAVGQSIFDPQEWFSRLDYLNCSVNKKFDKFPEAK